MAQENITVKLPGSKGTAVIRSFVKNKDRKAVQRALMAGKEMGQNDDPQNITIPASNLTDMVEAQVRALLISVNDITDDPYEVLMESEFEKDLTTVEEAVQKVFDKGGKVDPKGSTSGA
jgi:hypothetical protein